MPEGQDNQGSSTGRPDSNSRLKKLLQPYHDIASTIFSSGRHGEIDQLFINAAKEGDYERIENFLQRRSDAIVNVDVKDKITGNTPIIWAVKRGHTKIVQLLLKHGADITLRNYDGQTAVEVASPSLRRVLLDSVSRTGAAHRYLLQAAWQGNVQVVRQLLNEGRIIDINCRNADGLTPLLLVTRDVDLFEKIGAQLQKSYNPLEVILELLSHDADPSIVDPDGKTSLHHLSSSKAAIAGKLVETMVHACVDTECKDRRCFTPIHCASEVGNVNVVLALIDGGSDVNSRTDGGATPLHITAYKGHDKVASQLLKNGADVTSVDDNGLTPVDWAKSKKVKATLRGAWAEITKDNFGSKSSLSSVKPLSREGSSTSLEQLQTPKPKKKKGEVIFDSLPTTGSNTRGVFAPPKKLTMQQLSEAHKALKAEEQMLKDIELGLQPYSSIRDGPRVLGTPRHNFAPAPPKVPRSPEKVASQRNLTPLTNRGRRTSTDSVISDNSDWNLPTSTQNVLTRRPSDASRKLAPISNQESSFPVKLVGSDLNETLQDLRVKQVLQGAGMSRRPSDISLSSATNLSDLAATCDEFMLKGRSPSVVSVTDLDLETISPPPRLTPIRTPSGSDRGRLKIPGTIREEGKNNVSGTRTVLLDLDQMVTKKSPSESPVYQDGSLHPNSRKILPPTPVLLSRKQYSFEDAKLVDISQEFSSKESSPRSDEDSPRIIDLTTGKVLPRSRSILNGNFNIEESRTMEHRSSPESESPSPRKQGSLTSSVSSLSTPSPVSSQEMNAPMTQTTSTLTSLTHVTYSDSVKMLTSANTEPPKGEDRLKDDKRPSVPYNADENKSQVKRIKELEDAKISKPGASCQASKPLQSSVLPSATNSSSKVVPSSGSRLREAAKQNAGQKIKNSPPKVSIEKTTKIQGANSIASAKKSKITIHSNILDEDECHSNQKDSVEAGKSVPSVRSDVTEGADLDKEELNVAAKVKDGVTFITELTNNSSPPNKQTTKAGIITIHSELMKTLRESESVQPSKDGSATSMPSVIKDTDRLASTKVESPTAVKEDFPKKDPEQQASPSIKNKNNVSSKAKPPLVRTPSQVAKINSTVLSDHVSPRESIGKGGGMNTPRTAANQQNWSKAKVDVKSDKSNTDKAPKQKIMQRENESISGIPAVKEEGSNGNKSEQHSKNVESSKNQTSSAVKKTQIESQDTEKISGTDLNAAVDFKMQELIANSAPNNVSPNTPLKNQSVVKTTKSLTSSDPGKKLGGKATTLSPRQSANQNRTQSRIGKQSSVSPRIPPTNKTTKPAVNTKIVTSQQSKMESESQILPKESTSVQQLEKDNKNQIECETSGKRKENVSKTDRALEKPDVKSNSVKASAATNAESKDNEKSNEKNDALRQSIEKAKLIETQVQQNSKTIPKASPVSSSKTSVSDTKNKREASTAKVSKSSSPATTKVNTKKNSENVQKSQLSPNNIAKAKKQGSPMEKRSRSVPTVPDSKAENHGKALQKSQSFDKEMPVVDETPIPSENAPEVKIHVHQVEDPVLPRAVTINFFEHTGPVIEDAFEHFPKPYEMDTQKPKVQETMKLGSRSETSISTISKKKDNKQNTGRSKSFVQKKTSKNSGDNKQSGKKKSAKNMKVVGVNTSQGRKNEDAIGSKGQKRVRSSGKKRKKDTIKIELSEKADLSTTAFIGGIGWHIETDCHEAATVTTKEDSSDEENEKCVKETQPESTTASQPEVNVENNAKLAENSLTAELHVDIPTDRDNVTGLLGLVSSDSDFAKSPRSRRKPKRSPRADKIHKELLEQLSPSSTVVPSLIPQTIHAIKEFAKAVKDDSLDELLGSAPQSSYNSYSEKSDGKGSPKLLLGLNRPDLSELDDYESEKATSETLGSGMNTYEKKLHNAEVLSAQQKPEDDSDDSLPESVHDSVFSSSMTSSRQSSGSKAFSSNNSSRQSSGSKNGCQTSLTGSSGSKFAQQLQELRQSAGKVKEGIEEDDPNSDKRLNASLKDHIADLKSSQSDLDDMIKEILRSTPDLLNKRIKSGRSVLSANTSVWDSDPESAYTKQSTRKPRPRKSSQGLTTQSETDSYEKPDILPSSDMSEGKAKTPGKVKIMVKEETSEQTTTRAGDKQMEVENRELEKLMHSFRNMELLVGPNTGEGSVCATPRNLQPTRSNTNPVLTKRPPSGKDGRPVSATGSRSPRNSRRRNLALAKNKNKQKDSTEEEARPPGDSPEKKDVDMMSECSSELGSDWLSVCGSEEAAADTETLTNNVAQAIIHASSPESRTYTSRLGRRSRQSSRPASVCTNHSESEELIQWKKGNVLGKGAFGTVWCGLTSGGELIAVKQIELNTTDMDKAEREYEKIQEEVELLKTLKHKNIVGYLGTSLDDKWTVVSIFMQFVPGGSVANLLARFGALEESVFCRYTKQILEGVEYLHANNVIHRDIKGGNIMLMPNGIIKLIDFGCAKRLCINLSMSHSQILKSMKGTPYWMAPEVVTETGHGKKSDIWSIGCTVFEMATRKPPWASMPPMAAIFAIGSDKAVPELPDTFSEEARDFTKQCLTRDQNERLTATELLQHDFITMKRK